MLGTCPKRAKSQTHRDATEIDGVWNQVPRINAKNNRNFY